MRGEGEKGGNLKKNKLVCLRIHLPASASADLCLRVFVEGFLFMFEVEFANKQEKGISFFLFFFCAARSVPSPLPPPKKE